MDPFDLLGLDEDASERDVRRAYAQRLKRTRPDDDPVAFQRLHEAYVQALAHCRYRDSYADEAAEEEAVEMAFDAFATHSQAAVALPARPDEMRRAADTLRAQADGGTDRWEDASFAAPDVATDRAEHFIADLLQRLHEDDEQAIGAWLRAHPALYSLEVKQRLGEEVMRTLCGMDTLPSRRRVEVVLRFFGMDAVQPDGWSAYHLHALWDRLEGATGFEDVLRSHGDDFPVDRMMMNELRRPRSGWRRAFLLLCPMCPSRVRTLLAEFEAHGEEAVRRLDANAVDFWQRVNDRNRIDWRRLLVPLLRIPLLAVPLAAYFYSVVDRPFTAQTAIETAGGFAAAWTAWAGAIAGIRRVVRWNRAHYQWDLALVSIALAVGGGLALATRWPLTGAIVIGVAIRSWLSSRESGAIAFSLLAAFAVFIFGMATIGILTQPEHASWSRWPYLLGMAYTAAAFVAHDMLLAHRRGLSLAQARSDGGWLGRLAVLHCIGVIVLMVLVAVF